MKQLVKSYFSTLSAIAPKMAGNQAFELFQKPINKKIRPKEKSFFDKMKSFRVKHYLEDIQCYELGANEGELVILVHGWESNAASMSGIGLELAEQGYHVILFNLPAHGHSKLKKANLKLCKEALLALLAHINPREPFSIVSHSFGSAVTAYALSKTSYRVKNLVFLTSPNSIVKVFDDYSRFIGLNRKAQSVLENRATDILKEPLDGIVVEHLHDKINYASHTIIHDEKDKVIPVSESQKVNKAWSGSELIVVHNKGHYRMLWDREVIDHIISALKTENEDRNIEKLTAVSF